MIGLSEPHINSFPVSKTSKPYTHLVDMIVIIDGERLIQEGMEAVVYENGNIHFVRNDDGVTAWHCNNIHKNDWNVHKITAV